MPRAGKASQNDRNASNIVPRNLKGKELLTRHTINVNQTVLHEFANLAKRLGFKSLEIITLKENPRMRDVLWV